MKRLIIILGFIFFINISSFCQVEYDPIMSESKIWSNLSGGYGSEMVECCYTTTFLKIETDPYINTVDEKQVLASTDSLKTWTKIGNIKEKDKKIYFRDLDNNQDLIYDFGAAISDFITIVNYSHSNDYDTIVVQVVNIDTIDCLGIERQRYEVRDTLNGIEDYWITGIGSVKGLLNPCTVLCGGFRELLCLHDKDVQIYQDTDRMVCYLDDNSTGINNYSSIEFKIFPNPSTGLINIDYNRQDIDLTYTVSNSIGQVIDSGQLQGQNTTLTLDKGFYILSIMGENRLIFTEKFVIIE